MIKKEDRYWVQIENMRLAFAGLVAGMNKKKLLDKESISAIMEVFYGAEDKCSYTHTNKNKPHEAHTKCGYWITYAHRSEWKYCPFCRREIKEVNNA